MKSEARSVRRLPPKADAAVSYRGIKIEPISGKRSATAKAIREALFKQSVNKQSVKKRRQAALG